MVFKASKSWRKTSAKWQGWSEPENSSWERGRSNPSASTGYACRLYARDFAPTKILRSYAATGYKVFFGEGGDAEVLENENMRKWLTPDNSELSRRPCRGVSMAGKSVAGVAATLGGSMSASKELAALFSKAGEQQHLRD